MCEAQDHQANSFVTLTFKDDPKGLQKCHFQKFIRAFRKKLKQKIRYFAVGEYGTKNNRAHFHAIIFGWEPDLIDQYPIRSGLVGSHLLDATWKHGFTSVGTLTPASAAYVSQYVMKKITGREANETYTDIETGEFLPEFSLISRKPGIGRKWIEQNFDECFRDDSIYFSGSTVRPPKYYFDKLKEKHPLLADLVAKARMQDFDENEYYRLVVDGVFEKVLRSRLGVTEKRHKEI